jgi:hypothetical protein
MRQIMTILTFLVICQFQEVLSNLEIYFIILAVGFALILGRNMTTPSCLDF